MREVFEERKQEVCVGGEEGGVMNWRERVFYSDNPSTKHFIYISKTTVV